jgi:hypothetical protein
MYILYAISYVTSHSCNVYNVLEFARGHTTLRNSEECGPFKRFFLPIV